MREEREIHGLTLEQWYMAYKDLWKRYHALRKKVEKIEKEIGV